jgi:hypothetical protein
MKKLIIFSVLVGLLAGCGTPVRIYTDLDPDAAFEVYQTYSFLDFTDGNKKTITGMELERIRVAFARELEKRGLRFVEEGGDVSVQITVYHRMGADPYYYSPYRRSYMERALAIDIYDNLTKKHVWHGAAVGELVQDAEARAENLPEVVDAIFEKYPVQLSAGV